MAVPSLNKLQNEETMLLDLLLLWISIMILLC